MATSNQIISAGIKGGVIRALEQAGVPLTPEQKNAIASSVIAEAAPIVLNQTNNESPLQSRVTIGNAVSLLAVFAGALGVEIAPEEQALLVTGIAGAVAVGGAIYSLVGRWKAKKPIGA